MTALEQKEPTFRSRGILSARRFALLATTVAGLGAAAVVVPQTVDSNFFATPAVAENLSAEAKSMPAPAGFADVVAKVKPAVVSVRVKIDNRPQLSSNSSPDSSLEHFFRRFGMPFGMDEWSMPDQRRGGSMPDPWRQRRYTTGQGSGFFISADGYAVTNYHVVNGAKTVEVATDDGKTYDAKVVGTDQRTDLALIKVDGRSDFPFVKLSDTPPRIGDWVLAIGNPFGLSSTVTAGIVSARGRDIGSSPYDFIQIDAPVNRGNSGGPTFDINGNVVGVNAAIFSPSGGNVGIAFAVPAETVKEVVAQLREHGSVTRGWMGAQVQSITADVAESLGLKKAEGALIAEPQAGSPASKAGIKAGDVVLSIDGSPVKDARDLARKIADLAPGSTIKLGIMRNGSEQTLTLTLGEMSAQRQARADAKDGESDEPKIGVTVAPAGSVVGSGDKGVVVTSVDPNGLAAEKGFRTGDVILEVGGQAVSSAEEVRKALADARSKDKGSVLMRVKSGETTKYVAVPLARA
jgi:serine protease Do